MASTKLSNDLKNTIRKKLVNSVFKADIDNAVATIGQLAYERLMTPQRSSLPQFLIKDDWISTTTGVTINWHRDGRRVDYDYFDMPTAVPVRATAGRPYVDVVIDDENDGLAVVYRNWTQLKERCLAMERDVQSVLDSCNTSKQLVEMLPAAEPYIPDVARPTALIAQDVLDRLNKLLVRE